MNPLTAAGDPGGSTREKGGSPPAAAPPASAVPAPPASAAAARDRVCRLLEHAGIGLDSVTAADALLVVSELVTNAVRHGGGITAFHTEIADDALYLSVSDASPRAPSSRTGSPDHPGGYGWPLIQRLTEHIGISSRPDGKTISTVLRLT
ncbi:ATP-binding protein [Streptomyces sp. cmx-4-9]|uniref:ATP-binding protein n=1 Tax=Streptomyces sp. cmx-4-9 TaxID=2790941 RepID=UPI0039803749